MTERTVIVMRHAKSSWDGGVSNDYDRPLSARGRRDAQAMGRWLSDQVCRLQKIVSSPAERAKQTTNIVARHMDQQPATEVEWCESIYQAEIAALLEILNRNITTESLMMVGHNPGMESLVRYLAPDIGDQIRQQKLVPTAGLFVFRINRDHGRISRGSGQLILHQRPKNMPRQELAHKED